MPMDRGNRRSHLINEAIRIPQVRLIDTDGNFLGIMPTRDALNLARDKDLDLVMISDKAEPPVCQIIDYGKYKYEMEKKERKSAEANKSTLKELKMRYTIEEHDYKVRYNQAEKFLKAGDKVKFSIKFRGREIQHSHLAENLLNRMAKDLEEVGEVQQAPKKEGSNMMMLISPKSAKTKSGKNQPVETPTSKHQNVEAPIPRNQPVEAPIPRNQPVDAPIPKNQTVEAPILKEKV